VVMVVEVLLFDLVFNWFDIQIKTKKN